MFGPDPLSIAFVVVCAAAAVMAGVLAFLVRNKAAIDRDHFEKASNAVSALGLVKTAKAFSAWATNNPKKWHYLTDLLDILTGKTEHLLDELKGAVKHVAGTVEGRKMLTDALASVPDPSVATAKS
jgi:hypothetical protein